MIPARQGPRTLVAAAVFPALLAALCAGCERKFQLIEESVARFTQGRTEQAVAELTTLMDDIGHGHRDYPLALLERGMMALVLGRPAPALRDFEEADTLIEILDYTGDAPGVVARYLFSEDAALYRGAPYEKAALQSMAQLAALALDDPQQAIIAARRGDVNATALFDDAPPTSPAHPALWFLLSLGFEAGGEHDNARILAQRAFETASHPLYGRHLAHLALMSASGAAATNGPLPEPPPVPTDAARVVLVAMVGFAPHRVPHSESLSVETAGKLKDAFQDQDLMALVGNAYQYAGMETRPSPFERCLVREHEGMKFPLTAGGADYQAQAMNWWQGQESAVMAAAASRFITRWITGELVGAGLGAVAEKQTDSEAVGDLFGTIFNLFTQAAMAKMDVPDTRCWRMLPRELIIADFFVAPGPFHLEVEFSGPGATRTLPLDGTARAGGLHVLPVMALP